MYDLIILGYVSDYLPIFKELEDQQNVHLISPLWSNPRELLHFLFQIDLAYKKEKPNLNYPNQSLGKTIFFPENPTCYVFFRDWYPLFASGYIQRCKKRQPRTKFCWFFSDLVASYPGINIERMRSEFDLILSFDPEDAKQYDFVYCPLSYSPLPEAKEWQKQRMCSDVFFMGTAKQRLDLVFAVYERLRNGGVNCDFHIVGASLQDQRYVDEIHYSNFIPYHNYLQNALASRCILEILQDSAHHGFTARTGEALVYGRKLLSNNTSLTAASFYDPRQMSVFSNPEKIDLDFIKNDWQPRSVPSPFSPIHTLKLIEKHLNINLLKYEKLS